MTSQSQLWDTLINMFLLRKQRDILALVAVFHDNNGAGAETTEGRLLEDRATCCQGRKKILVNLTILKGSYVNVSSRRNEEKLHIFYIQICSSFSVITLYYKIK